MSDTCINPGAVMAERNDKAQESAESDMSGVEADTESGDTPVNADMSDSSSVRSLFDSLRSPAPSALARKRKLRTNPPSGFKKGKGAAKGDPKRISPSDRLREYQHENLTVSNRKLFCTACREELSTKKSSLESHIKSKKHATAKQRMQLNIKRDAGIADALRKYDCSVHPVGEGLPECTRVYRVNVVTAMLKSGLPIHKIDCFRSLLEEHAFSLTSSSNLRQIIPFIHKNEMEKIKEAVDKKHVSIIFDGTTHVCEAMVIVVRYVTDDWLINQRVCRLMLLAKSMTGEEVARQIIMVLTAELGISSTLLVGAMRDRASVNEVAMRTVRVIYNEVIDIGCFSHTLDHVGERMQTPILEKFFRAWISLFSRSPKTRLLWKGQTGLSCPSHSSTRWWSLFEVVNHLFCSFGDLAPFLENEELSGANLKRLREIMDDQPTQRKLKIEMAVTIDGMEPFVKATYFLEGDGPLALHAYERISSLFSAISTHHFPNVISVARALSNGNPSHERQLLAYADSCVQPAYSYFRQKFEHDLKGCLDIFKAARLFSPSKFNEMKPTVTDIDSLKVFTFFDTSTIAGLKSELPSYAALTEDMSSAIDPLTWWRDHKDELPLWASACKCVLLLQPSSAAAERVFSILSNSFNSQQESSLEDYTELSVILQYNNRSSN